MDKAVRLVIPKPLREELHREPGDSLDMESAGKQIREHRRKRPRHQGK